MPLALCLDALEERHVREIWNAYAPNIPNIDIPDDLVDSFIKMLHKKIGTTYQHLLTIRWHPTTNSIHTSNVDYD
jgi:hypothetical protein